ncbi:MAG: tetratricopeptide repeat protein, partial [Candidatus Zixiibacteriota bacterium]
AEAFQHYQAGMKKFSLGLLDESIGDFKAAIAVDSTFALPYMRIGMSHTFQGRQQLAVPSFEKARAFQDKLPVRERSLLDVYVDLWLERDFDHAFTKMESFVRNYPDDKEGRAIYGLLIHAFDNDSLRAFAQFDTALILDPAYSFALDQYSAIESQYENYDRAIELIAKMLNSSPSSPDPYLRLAGLYRRQGKLDDALTQLETAAERFPRRADILSGLGNLQIHKRDFAKAESFIEKARKSQEDDPYRLIDYYSAKANVANWRGQLHKGMTYRFKALQQARMAGDSIQLFSALTTIATYYHYYGLDDSALYYLEESRKWANQLQRISYPFALLKWMPEKADEALPLLRQEVQAMMTRLPTELSWFADFFEVLGQAFITADTTAMMAAYEKAIPKQSPAQQDSNRRDLGYLRILAGDYRGGKELLVPFVQPSHRYFRDARNYIYTLYHIGIADQGLGNTADAQAAFSDVLKYWGDADIELDWIQDTRDRLAQIRG